MPQSWPLMTSETDIEASVPMFFMYCRCTGDTARRPAKLRSVGAPVSGSSSGASRAGW